MHAAYGLIPLCTIVFALYLLLFPSLDTLGQEQRHTNSYSLRFMKYRLFCYGHRQGWDGAIRLSSLGQVYVIATTRQLTP